MSRRSQLRRGLRDSLRRLEGLMKTERDHDNDAGNGVQDEVQKVGDAQEGDILHHVSKALAPETSTSGRRIRTSLPSSLPASPPPGRIENDDDDDDDEGWASDRSASPDTLDADASSTADRNKKLKTSKARSSPTRRLSSHPLGAERRGRRTSLRRGHTQPSSLSEADPPVTVDIRGRSPVPISAHSQIHTPIPSPTRSRSHIPSLTNKSEGSHSRHHSRHGTSDSVRNQRLEHIRAMHSLPPTREASPSRSVWFADEVPPLSASASISMDLARSLPPTPPNEA